MLYLYVFRKCTNIEYGIDHKYVIASSVEEAIDHIRIELYPRNPKHFEPKHYDIDTVSLEEEGVVGDSHHEE